MPNKTNGRAIPYNLEKLNRKPLFTNCEHGYNNYPTDLDFIFNVRNEINIITDAKEKGKKPVLGQTITYINITDVLEESGIPSYIVWVEHDPSDDMIYFADCEVVKIYHNKTWINKDKICSTFGCPLLYKDLQKILFERHDVEPYNPHKHKFDRKRYLG